MPSKLRKLSKVGVLSRLIKLGTPGGQCNRSKLGAVSKLCGISQPGKVSGCSEAGPLSKLRGLRELCVLSTLCGLSIESRKTTQT